MTRVPRVTAIALVVSATHLGAADPQTAIHWTASQLAETEKQIKSSVDPARHLGIERLLDSATLIYRDGPSEAEVHLKLADFITVRAGEGEVVVGGTIVDGKSSAPDELRGPSIQGGTRYKVAAGDILYIPANTVHQFFVAPGKNFTVTIVKITPKS
jgi:mannose-6-phosphate isomerase-like protein (cupin superfamily)